MMDIPLRRGRFFNDQDRMGNEPVVVIDEVLAQHAFGAGEPVASGAPEIRGYLMLNHEELQMFQYPHLVVPAHLLKRVIRMPKPSDQIQNHL
jgi:hypothetical protein